MTAVPRSRSGISPARKIATNVLLRVDQDQAYASPTLDAELKRFAPTDRDARLAAEIVYGSLRVLPSLDAALLRHLARGKPEPFTWAALRVAAYQALHLGRVPSFAIAQETVSIVRHKRGEGLSRLTNAVLRKLLRERPEEAVPPTALQVPEWVAESLTRGLGPLRAHAMLNAGEAAVPLGVRAVRVSAEALLAAIQAAVPAARVQRSQVAKDALSVRGGGDPRRWPGHAEGHFAVQDEGAQAVGELLCAAPGERIWDACAGRGGKSLQLAQSVGAAGRVVASDLYPEKLSQLDEEAARLGLTAQVECLAANLEVGTGAVRGPFDRVLVDAPCTGLGTIRRRPEILLRLGPDDPARMGKLQLAILQRCLPLVRPGGRLTFATCSPSHEEGVGVVEAFSKLHSQLAPVRDPEKLSGHVPDADGIVRFGPWSGGDGGPPDAYQAISWDIP